MAKITGAEIRVVCRDILCEQGSIFVLVNVEVQGFTTGVCVCVCVCVCVPRGRGVEDTMLLPLLLLPNLLDSATKHKRLAWIARAFLLLRMVLGAYVAASVATCVQDYAQYYLPGVAEMPRVF